MTNLFDEPTQQPHFFSHHVFNNFRNGAKCGECGLRTGDDSGYVPKGVQTPGERGGEVSTTGQGRNQTLYEQVPTNAFLKSRTARPLYPHPTTRNTNERRGHAEL